MQDIHNALVRLPELLTAAASHSADAATSGSPLYYGRHCSVAFMLEVGSSSFYIDIDRGMLAPVVTGPLKMKSWGFAIRASEHSFRKFWSLIPPPGYNDIFAMTSYQHARIDGDISLLLKDLRFIKTIVALPRGHIDSASTGTDRVAP